MAGTIFVYFEIVGTWAGNVCLIQPTVACL